MTAAVFCRSSRQDDCAGHQNLQQDHQDEVEVDLKAGRRKTSREVLQVERLRKYDDGETKGEKRGFVTLTAEGFRTSLHPNQTRQVVVTANVDT